MKNIIHSKAIVYYERQVKLNPNKEVDKMRSKIEGKEKSN
jgi:hypothetical protein